MATLKRILRRSILMQETRKYANILMTEKCSEGAGIQIDADVSKKRKFFLPSCTRNFCSGSNRAKMKPYRVIRECGEVFGPPAVTVATELPPYALSGIVFPPNREIEIKNEDEIKKMRKACRTARLILACASKLIEICGDELNTYDLENVLHANMTRFFVYPSMLGFKGYPKAVGTSINNVVKHGLPDNVNLQDGDIISVDVSVYQNGFHGDTCKTFRVGEVDDKAEKLITTTEKCLDEAIKICGPGVRFNQIGKVISSIAQENGFSVCPYFVGHGIGSDFHAPPQILHHENNYPGRMKPGMTFTIEPILCEGSSEIEILDDGWTAVTEDDGRAAQCEHTVLITEHGAEVLTEDQEDDDKRAADLVRYFKHYGLPHVVWRT